MITLLRLWRSVPDALEQNKQLWLGDFAITLYVDGGEEVLHLCLVESPRFVEGGIELVEEIVDLLELQGATAVIIVDLEDLVDVHAKDIVVH